MDDEEKRKLTYAVPVDSYIICSKCLAPFSEINDINRGINVLQRLDPRLCHQCTPKVVESTSGSVLGAGVADALWAVCGVQRQHESTWQHSITQPTPDQVQRNLSWVPADPVPRLSGASATPSILSGMKPGSQCLGMFPPASLQSDLSPEVGPPQEGRSSLPIANDEERRSFSAPKLCISVYSSTSLATKMATQSYNADTPVVDAEKTIETLVKAEVRNRAAGSSAQTKSQQGPLSARQRLSRQQSSQKLVSPLSQPSTQSASQQHRPRVTEQHRYALTEPHRKGKCSTTTTATLQTARGSSTSATPQTARGPPTSAAPQTARGPSMSPTLQTARGPPTSVTPQTERGTSMSVSPQKRQKVADEEAPPAQPSK